MFLVVSFLWSGCRDAEAGKMLKTLFQADYFRIVVVEDATTVELCGALKVISLSHAGATTWIGFSVPN